MAKKRNYKWFFRSVIGALIGFLAWVVFVFIYVAGQEDHLMRYQRSLEKLPEVEQVLEISQFTGVDEYYVAKVELTTGEVYVYFVQQEVVVKRILSEDLISVQAAIAIAKEVTGNDEVRHTHLGMLKGDPIFEVMLETSQGVEYVVIHGKTRDVLLHFEL